jgi:lysophospholipase L1-like esterase
LYLLLLLILTSKIVILFLILKDYSYMKRNKFLAYTALAIIAMSACKPTIDSPSVSPGTASFTKYVSFGNSLTSGYGDNGLYNEGIINSYPNFIAQQMAKVGGGSFVVPVFPDANGNGTGYQILTGFTTTTIPSPIIGTVLPNANTGTILGGGGAQLVRFTGANNNLGVPGLAIWQVTNTGTAPNLLLPLAQINPFFERLVEANSTKDYVQVAKDSDHTFFTFWLGNNDVLGYATGGGVASASSFITPTATFNEKYDKMIDALTSKGAKGVLGTIPDVTALPFFTTVNGSVAATANPTTPTFPIVVLDAAGAAGLNGVYATPGLNGLPTGTTYSGFNFVAGNNYFLINVDNPATTTVIEVRHMDPTKDFFTLTASSVLYPTGLTYSGAPTTLPVTSQLAIGMGAAVDVDKNAATPPVPKPIPDFAVLDKDEIAEIKTATDAFNAKIKASASAKGLAVVDAKAIFDEVIANKKIDGVNITTAYITGGLFSLDGVHPTPKGYMIIANQFIKVINATYGSNIPFWDVNNVNPRGVKFLKQ